MNSHSLSNIVDIIYLLVVQIRVDLLKPIYFYFGQIYGNKSSH